MLLKNVRNNSSWHFDNHFLRSDFQMAWQICHQFPVLLWSPIMVLEGWISTNFECYVLDFCLILLNKNYVHESQCTERHYSSINFDVHTGRKELEKKNTWWVIKHLIMFLWFCDRCTIPGWWRVLRKTLDLSPFFPEKDLSPLIFLTYATYAIKEFLRMFLGLFSLSASLSHLLLIHLRSSA